MAVETRGIRHVHLLVSDHARSVAFYEGVFGMKVAFSDGRSCSSGRWTDEMTSRYISPRPRKNGPGLANKGAVSTSGSPSRTAADWMMRSPW